MLSMIACISADRGLGYQGELLWHIPEDMAFFRATTLGHPVVMGRKTFESIGRPLPGRKNCILTRDAEDFRTKYSAFFQGSEPENNHNLLTKSDKCATMEVYPSCDRLDGFLTSEKDEAFIIGGASLYAIYLNRADVLYLTEVEATKPADAFFPDFDRSLYTREVLKTSMFDGVAFAIVKYTKK